MVTLAILFVVHSSIYAAWTPAPANPLSGNIEAPINTTVVTQSKNGNIAVNTLAAMADVRANRYCDAVGQNCVSALGKNSPIQYGVASGVFKGGKRLISGYDLGFVTFDSTETFTVVFDQPFAAVPVISVQATKDGSMSSICVESNDLTKTVEVTKDGFTATFSALGAPSSCVLPSQIDWIAVGS